MNNTNHPLRWTACRPPFLVSALWVLVLTLVCSFSLLAQPPDWTIPDETTRLQFQSNVIATVFDDGVRSTDLGDQVAAFIVNDDGVEELRGSARAQDGEDLGVLFFITVFSDEVGEDIIFRVYQNETDQIYTTPVTLVFRTPDGHGSVEEPIELPLGDVFGGVDLPVSWLSFEGAGTPKGEVDLSWSTAAEVDNRGFTVQRSTNGERFEDLGFVAAVDENSATRAYSFKDHNTPSGPDAYYRLRQEDFDGSFAFSNVIQVSLQNALGSLTVYPNPIRPDQELTVNFTVPDNGPVEVRVIAADGRTVHRRTHQAQAGSNTMNFSGADLHYSLKGVGWLVIRQGEYSATKQLRSASE